MNIHQFLNQRDIRAEKGNRYTHTSIKPAGTYLIEVSNIEKFWTLYCEQCHDIRLTITEKPESVMPILCDVDIKIESPIPNELEEIPRLYDDTMILSLIQIYKTVLFEILQNLKEEDFLCCVLEKEPYFITSKNGEKTYKKNGFHLHFPRIFVSRYIQETEMMPRIIQEIKKKNISKTFSFEKCIDQAYCKGGPWLMYGSSKSSNNNDPMYHPYEISYCINYEMEKMNYRNALFGYNIYNVNQDKINFSINEVDYYLPRILSIFMFHRNEYLYELRTDIPSIGDGILVTKKMNRDNQFPGMYNSCEDYELIERLLTLLKPFRYTDRNEWITVGWILFNVTNGSKDGFELWNQFSMRAPDKYDRNSCTYEWNRMTKRDMTMGSLKFLAKTDNPDEYKRMMLEFMRPHINNSLELRGSHNDLAKALYEKYESDYVCASIQNKIWFQFIDHIWCRLDEGITLRQKISDEMPNILFDKLHSLNADLQHFHNEQNDTSEKKTKKLIDNVYSLIGKLKNAQFKTSIMREAMEVFHDGHFIKKLDSDPYLIAFQNGVYDLKSHEFRDGRPSDYISLKLPIKYRDDLDIQHPDVDMVKEFFTKIFPDKTVREYFIHLSCEVFVGGNHNKIFQIWTGEGDNGKSIMQTLFEKMLGPYSIKLPTSLITGKRTQSSAACPELVRAGNGVRMAMLQEPDQSDTINIGILKELSGNDTFFARGLYKEGQEITPMFKLVLICNEPPKLPYNDRATWNRIRVIPFESTFTDNAPESWEEQLRQKRFTKDKDFGNKIPRMAEPFAWLLLHTLKFRHQKLVEPEKVLMATSNYRKKNDIYRQFIDENIIEHPTSSISLTELYSYFKDWYRESMPSQGGVPTKQDLKEYIIKIWGKPIKNVSWFGFKFSQDNDPSISTNDSLPPL